MVNIFRVFGRAKRWSFNPSPEPVDKSPNKLQKVSRHQNSSSHGFISLDEAPRNVPVSQHALETKSVVETVPRNSESTAIYTRTSRPPHEPQPPMKSNNFNDSGVFINDYAKQEDLKRTRSKTPCFWIGQLETSAMDPASDFAKQYQDMLPERTFTPCEPRSESRTQMRRKAEGEKRPRELSTCQEIVTDDSDTLVGSESASRQGSSSPGRVSPAMIPELKDRYVTTLTTPESTEDIGLQICMSLLASRLAASMALPDKMETFSRLQTLLMIQTCESIQQDIGRQFSLGPFDEGDLQSLEAAQSTVQSWLEALRWNYDICV